MTKNKSDSEFQPNFKNLNKDIERYLAKFGKEDKNGNTPVISGYDNAQKVVFDLYLEHGAYEAVVQYVIACWNWNWGVNEFFLKASRVLEKNVEYGKLKRIWRAAIAAQKGLFWQLHALKGEIDAEKSLKKIKKITLDHMNQYHDVLKRMDDIKEFERVSEEIELLKCEERRRTQVKPNSLKIDEKVFWDIISKAAEGRAVAEQVELITSLLENFKASEITRFDKILTEKMQLAFTWDIWALAFLSQQGCSDDAFEYFRAWLILQGQEVFERALSDVNKVVKDIPAGIEAEAEGLLMAPVVAYEFQAGKLLPPTKRKQIEPAGKEWQEEELPTLYPKIAAYYEH